jgi:hypothetical protein
MDLIVTRPPSSIQGNLKGLMGAAFGVSESEPCPARA